MVISKQTGTTTAGQHTEKGSAIIIFNCGAVSECVFYPNGTIEVKRVGGSNTPPTTDVSRETIKYLSRRSLARLAYYATESSVKYESIMTLTYGVNYPLSGKKVKANLSRFLITAKRKKIVKSYLWFMEFQKRGAPHIHILNTVKAETEAQRIVFAETWTAIISNKYRVRYSNLRTRKELWERGAIFRKHCNYRQWENAKKPDGIRRYAMKYAMKPEQKVVPEAFEDVGRFWGVDQETRASMPKGVTVEIKEREIRELLELNNHRCADWDILPKYIWGGKESET
ncbi:MAG: hypothetical protein KAV87_57610 [Desulfobacteraceae bacterium]|nr:hypothetical protein [Desulfobacteraceae bacterium]